MSESDTSSQSPRKSEPEISSLRGAVPKRKPFRRSTKKVVKRPETPYEFYQADSLSDVAIKAEEKTIYMPRCLLVYNSKVFAKLLEDEVGGRGQRSSGKTAIKEIDMSDKRPDDVVKLFKYLDPRESEPPNESRGVAIPSLHLTVSSSGKTSTEEKYPRGKREATAMRLAPLAAEYEIRNLQRDCERTLTDSYIQMRKGKRPGAMPTSMTLDYLKVSDKYGYQTLLDACIEDASANPHFDSMIDRMDDHDVSYPTQKAILRKKHIRMRAALAKQSREKEMTETDSKEDKRVWRI